MTNERSGQSYKALYDHNLLLYVESYWVQNCPYYDSRVEIYDHKIFIRLASVHSNMLRIIGKWVGQIKFNTWRVSIQSIFFIQKGTAWRKLLKLNKIKERSLKGFELEKPRMWLGTIELLR